MYLSKELGNQAIYCTVLGSIDHAKVAARSIGMCEGEKSGFPFGVLPDYCCGSFTLGVSICDCVFLLSHSISTEPVCFAEKVAKLPKMDIEPE